MSADPKMNPWTPTTDLAELRRLGKTMEELGELHAVLARCIIQGIDEIDPSSGKTNRQRLQEEIADVRAQIICTTRHYNLDRAFMARRIDKKVDQMAEWEALFGGPPPNARKAPTTLDEEMAAAGFPPRKFVRWGECKCVLTQYCDARCNPIYEDTATAGNAHA